MRLFVQVLFNLVYSFRNRTITALLFESFQAGEKPVGDQTLFFIDLPNVLFMGFAYLFRLRLKFSRLPEKLIGRDQHSSDHSQRPDQTACCNNCPYAYVHGFYLQFILCIKMHSKMYFPIN